MERLQQQTQEKKKEAREKDGQEGQENSTRTKSAGSKREKNGDKKTTECRRNNKEPSMSVLDMLFSFNPVSCLDHAQENFPCITLTR